MSFGDLKIYKDVVFNPFNLNVVECLLISMVLGYTIHIYLLYIGILFWLVKTGAKGFWILPSE